MWGSGLMDLFARHPDAIHVSLALVRHILLHILLYIHMYTHAHAHPHPDTHTHTHTLVHNNDHTGDSYMDLICTHMYVHAIGTGKDCQSPCGL